MEFSPGFIAVYAAMINFGAGLRFLDSPDRTESGKMGCDIVDQATTFLSKYREMILMSPLLAAGFHLIKKLLSIANVSESTE